MLLSYQRINRSANADSNCLRDFFSLNTRFVGFSKIYKTTSAKDLSKGQYGKLLTLLTHNF